MPSIGLEPRLLVVGTGEINGAVNGDAIVVPQHDQSPEAQMSGERGGLVADAFHQAAVTHDRVCVVIDEARKLGGEHALGQCHTHGGCESLAQRPRRHFDPGRVPDLRMSGRAGSDLPERAQLVHGQVVAEHVQQRVLQRTSVPGGEHETVAVGPRRLTGVVPEVPAEQRPCHRRGTHRHPRMPGSRVLHHVGGQEADRVDGQGIDGRSGTGPESGDAVDGAAGRSHAHTSRRSG